MPQAYHNFSFFILHFALIKTPLVLRKYKRRKFAVPLFFITLPITEGLRGLPFAPGRTFIPLPHPGFQPPTQALYRFRWDYSFRSTRYETILDCTIGYTGLSSHPMMEEGKCSGFHVGDGHRAVPRCLHAKRERHTGRSLRFNIRRSPTR